MSKRQTGKKQKMLHSTAVRMVLVIIALLLPFNIVTLVLVYVTVDNARTRVEEEIQASLDISASSLAERLDAVGRREIYLCVNSDNTEILEFSTSLEKYSNAEQARLLRSVQSGLKELLAEHPMADLVYLSFPKNGYVITSGTPGITRTTYMDAIEERQALGSGRGVEWSVLLLDDIMVLEGYFTWNQINAGVMLNLDWTLGKINLMQEDDERVLFFTNEEESIYSGRGRAFLEEEEMDFEELKKSGTYDLYLSELDGYDLKLVEVVRREGIVASLPVPLMILEGFCILLAALSMPAILYYEKKWILNPIGRLTKAIDRIEQGELEYRVEEDSSSKEFRQINQSFNAMMDQVSELKIHVYEIQLEKQQAKMKFLSQQIQPHFILNTLNILYSYEQEEYPLIQQMILLLSKYFRYIVNANSEFVTLRAEMDHIRNYFDIQQVRYPEIFFAMVEYDEEIGDCLVPPLLIQNFAENSIKHSIRIGNHIDIFVIAQKMETGQIRIRMVDTGEGINEETLEKINAFCETGRYQQGLGVGIQNAVERLKVLYGLETNFEISRDAPHGTRIEIVLPMHRSEAQGEEGGEV